MLFDIIRESVLHNEITHKNIDHLTYLRSFADRIQSMIDSLPEHDRRDGYKFQEEKQEQSDQTQFSNMSKHQQSQELTNALDLWLHWSRSAIGMMKL